MAWNSAIEELNMKLVEDLAERLAIASSPGHACDLIMELFEQRGYQFDRKDPIAIWISLLAKKWHDRLPGQFLEQAVRITERINQQT